MKNQIFPIHGPVVECDEIPGEIVDTEEFEDGGFATVYEVSTDFGLVLASFRKIGLNPGRLNSYVHDNKPPDGDHSKIDYAVVDRMLGFTSLASKVGEVVGVLTIAPRVEYLNTVLGEYFTEQNGLNGGIRIFHECYDSVQSSSEDSRMPADEFGLFYSDRQALVAAPDYELKRLAKPVLRMHAHDMKGHARGATILTDEYLEEWSLILSELNPDAIVVSGSTPYRPSVEEAVAGDIDRLTERLRINRWTSNFATSCNLHDITRAVFNLRNFMNIPKEQRRPHYGYEPTDRDERREQDVRVRDLVASLQQRSNAIVDLALSGKVDDQFPWLSPLSQ